MVNYHLVALVHGIRGNPSHMSYIGEQIERNCKPKDPNDKIIVLNTVCQSGDLTYDGIDVNGKRISDEILEKVKELQATGESVTKFSLIGYSLGGLAARYALGVLYHDDFFKTVQPVHFVTFSTPHVGVRNAGTTLSSKLYNFIGPFAVPSVGPQLFFTDRKVVGGKEYLPLLQWMTHPSSKFFKALELFKHKTLYANAINDLRTSWYTSFVSALDPFDSMVNETLSAYSLKYVKGYEPTIVDFSKPIEFNRVTPEKPPKFSIGRITYKGYVWLKLLATIVVIAPVYSLYVLYKSIKQRIGINKRVREFARESADSLKALYDAPSHADSLSSSYTVIDKESTTDEHLRLDDTVRDQTETFVESIYSALNSAKYYDYHHSVGKPSSSREDKEPLLKPTGPINLKGNIAPANFKVNLIPVQEDVIKNFNRLNWTKFPVIIKNTKSTHSAIIYRQEDPTFKEGQIVVDHFVRHVFKV